MRDRFLFIPFVLFFVFCAMGCDDDEDPNDPCTQMCERKVECNPDTVTFGDCKSECDDSAGEGNADEVDQACKDAALAAHECYMNANCDDFNAINSGETPDACAAKMNATAEACPGPK